MSCPVEEKPPMEEDRDRSYQNDEMYPGEAIVLQPQSKGSSHPEYPKGWSSSLFSCFDDMEVCLCSFFCPCIYVCLLADKFGEQFCTPYLPGAKVAIRTSIRHRFNIQGKIAYDSLAVLCCFPCSLSQMGRQLKTWP